jgi:hypothetical protein
MSAWDVDEALESLLEDPTQADVNKHDPTQIVAAVNQIFRENAQAAALSIVHAALHEPNARVRLDASKYVIERATALEGTSGDPLANIIKELYEREDMFPNG